MAISPLQPVTAAVNNAANMSRTVNTSTVGRVDVNNTTDSTLPTNGALHTTGGLGVEKTANIGTDLNVGNNIDAGGNVNATNVVASANVIADSVAANSVNAQSGVFQFSLDTNDFSAQAATVTSLTVSGIDVADISSIQTFTNKSISGATNTLTNISLTTAVTGVLPIANGGTSNGSLAVTAGGVLYTDGTKVVNVGTGTTGQVLTSNGAGAPTWVTASTGGGGGGGGSFKWYSPRGNGPVTDEEFEQEVYLFSEVFSSGSSGQYLTGNMKMANTFTGFTTTQGFLYFKAYTPATSGRYKFELTTTLIKDGVDSFASTANQHVASLEITISATANLDTILNLAYTDGSGLINGQTVTVNDTLKFKLRRIAASTSEDTNDIRLVPASTEIYI